MRIGIVGNGTDKFTKAGKEKALEIIAELLSPKGTVLVSGRSPAGGIDVWAEEIADSMKIEKSIWPPVTKSWSGYHGFKYRNKMIAKDSDIVLVIVVDKYPTEYRGKRFKICYHCKKNDHVKSGACWTAKYAQTLGKPVYWHIVVNYEDGNNEQ